MAPRLPGDLGVGPFGLLCVAMHNGFEDLDLDRLRRRRSEKWRPHPPDVPPAFIAEMDLPRAPHTPFVSLRGAAAEHRGTLASAAQAVKLARLQGAVAV